MLAVIVSVGAAIAGIAVVQMANGFLGTLVSMSSSAAGFTPAVVGVVLAAYYGGYTIGAATIGPVLQRVGHIRLFAALAGVIAASVALQPIMTSAAAWVFIRLVTGFGCAGLFITTESWLNASAQPQNRGTIFALYMVATNAAFGIGQFLINIPSPRGFELFSLAAAMFCIALVPVSLTRSVAPQVLPSPRLRLRELRRLAPVAYAGCATTGMISSAFYSLVPAYAQTQGVPPSMVAAYIATTIFGGLCFQIPVGKISDRFDRRLVAAGVAGGLAVTVSTLAIIPPSGVQVLVLTFLLGGFMSTIYPVCVAHAHDRVETERAVSTSGQLILIHGIASFCGPIMGTVIMGHGGLDGVFVFMATAAFIFCIIAIWRALRVEAPAHKERPFVFLNERMGQPISHVADDEGAIPTKVEKGR